MLAQDQALTPLAPPYPQLTQYFGFSTTQVGKIQSLNAAFQLYLGIKYARVNQVQQELTIETAKTALDPMALGIRYEELELICREAKNTQAELVKNVQAVLTPAQQPKWQVLQDAFKLMPVIQEAQQANLLPGGASPVAALTSGVVSTLVGGNANLPGCRSNPVSLLGILSAVPLENGPKTAAQ